MQFNKFSSLENTYNGKLISMCRDQFDPTSLWMVTEKVDGANFAFYFDGIELKIASRNQFVDGTFFACAPVVEELTPKIRKLFKLLELLEGVQVLTVYGELYGPNVQGRVNYGPKGFAGFEVEVDGVPLNKVAAFGSMLQCEIPIAPIIAITTFEIAVNYQHAFRSLLTPGDHDGENECEGIVIEPVEPARFGNGKRVYLKHKTEAFSERKGPTKVHVALEVPADVQAMLEVLTSYLTESRVHSVLSKLGEVTSADFGKVLKLTVQDAVEEFEKTEERCVGKELGANTGWLQKLLAKEATPVVRAVFLPLMS